MLCMYVNRRGGRQPLVFLQSGGLYGLLVLHVWGNAHVSSVVGVAWFASHAGAVHTSVDVRLNGGGLYGRQSTTRWHWEGSHVGAVHILVEVLVHGGGYNGVICMTGGGMVCMRGQFTTRWTWRGC